ncbi:unnamed protein product [Phyllotreta striolata]|uniref:Geminin n=1 Tax=Phyllotreta striolata TaxID=444603 RepID=A0A9N9TRG4_PHYSR|nr:unnamed protein product [Phyllotreta striolata]
MFTQKKVILTVGSQDQENTTECRKTFKELQKDARGHDNLIGRLQAGKETIIFKEAGESKRKKLQMIDKSVQAGEQAITAEDLVSEEPSLEYWKKLAETREQSLNDSLHEVEKLKDNISALQEENKVCKEMLDESKHLIEVLQEMLSESDDAES